MTPEFALVFSDETVTLLHRRDGWTVLGEAALDDPDLADHLARLRETGHEVAEGPFITKLAIPASQILYTTVPLSGDDHEAAIRAALDGMTPYEVADLAFDWEAAGSQAHVAVLARDTLDEAEAFATEYGFNPVAFTSLAPEGRRPAEPWFGPTTIAPEFTSQPIDRDPLPMFVVLPDDAPLPEESVTEEDDLPCAAPVEDAQEPVAPPSEEAPDHHWMSAAQPDDALHQTSVTEVERREPVDEEQVAAPAEAYPSPEAPLDEQPVSEPADADEAYAEPEPEPALDERPLIAPVIARSEPLDADPVPDADMVEPELPPAPPTAEPEPRPAPTAPLPVFEHPSFTKKPTLRADRDVTPRRVEPRVGVATAPKGGEAPFVDFAPAPKGPVADMTPPPLRVTQTQPRTTTGATPTSRRPRHLGLILTGLLLLVLAVIAAVSAYLGGSQTEVSQAVPEPSAEVTALAAPAPAAHPDGLPATTEAPDAPAVAPVQRAAADLAPFAASFAAAAAETRPDAPLLLAQAIIPDTRPQLRPDEADPAPTEAAPVTADAASVVSDVADERPRPRPAALAPAEPPTEEELVEVAAGEGMMASPRPARRPQNASILDVAALEEEGTALAVAISQRPETRPEGVNRASVNAALAAAMEPPPPSPAPAPVRTASAAVAAPPPVVRREVEADDEPEVAAVVPRIPVSASVAQQATEKNALPLGRTNIISITGKSSNRTALVREGNGRITRLKIGDRLDGGVIAAITNSAIHYRKGNQLYALEMPG